MQRRWRSEFGTPPTTPVAITKFQTDGTVQIANKTETAGYHSSANNESVATAVQAFTQSPKTSIKQGSCETGVPETSIHCIFEA